MSVRKRPSSLKNVDDFIEGKKHALRNKKEDRHAIPLRLPSKLYVQMTKTIDAMPISISINKWIAQAILEKVKNDTNIAPS